MLAIIGLGYPNEDATLAKRALLLLSRHTVWKIRVNVRGWSPTRPILLAVAVQPMLPALLEFESPTAALIEAPVKPAARSILWTVVSAVIASTAIAALFPIDMVVTGSGRVVLLPPTTVVQPLETAIVRAGELLARLDPTFSAADVSAPQAQVKSFQAEVDRLTAEASGTPYQPTSADDATALQVAIYGQRQAQYRYQMESYNQTISGLQAQLTRSEHDVEAFGKRVQIASVLDSCCSKWSGRTRPSSGALSM
jgi:hemolysin D